MSAKTFSEISSAKTYCLLEILSRTYGEHFQSALVVGCGTGHEAFAIQHRFQGAVEGIDIDGSSFETPPNEKTKLKVMDATFLDYPDNSFDLIYSFHAIEHIANLDSALREMKRTIRPGGVFCIGTPNKLRLVGYIGSPELLANKIRWNLNDYGMRLRGKWENRFGAHAGFVRSELREMCMRTFGECLDVTDAYYKHLYAHRRRFVEMILSLGIAERIFPAVYVVGRCEKTLGE
jgi:ubiquinone/menaquinone biosynthesis C-methylase UbiE